MKKRILLIDANALVHRAFHALPPLTTKTGQSVNAVYGFFQILFKALDELKPEYLVTAFDTPAKTFRHEMYSEYKATRQKADDDLYAQFPLIKELLTSFGVPIFEKAGYEADDIVGTLARQAEQEGMDVIIVTGDMDEVQLVNDNTEVYTMRRGFTDTVIYNPAAVFEKFTLSPDQIVDYKALRGDPSDNIPGVPGIGEKTAISLLREFHDLDNLFRAVDSDSPAISDRVKNTLRENRGNAYLSQKLAQIDTQVSLKLAVNEAIWGNFDRQGIIKKFQELEFRSLLAKIPEGRSDNKATISAKHEFVTVIVSEKAGLVEFIKEAGKNKVWVVDTETDSLDRLRPEIVGFSVSFGSGKGYYFPATTEQEREDFLLAIKPYLEDPSIAIVGHNLKYDYAVFKGNGVELAQLSFDTMLAAYLLNPGDRRYGLDDLAFAEFGYEKIHFEDLVGKGKGRIKMSQVPLEEIARYATEDVVMTYKLYEKYLPLLKEKGLLEIFKNLEMPLITVLDEMERNGIKVDKELLFMMSGELSVRIKALEAEIFEMAGVNFNLNSPAQLKKVLFEDLRIQDLIDKKQLKKVKSGGYSTAASELDKLKSVHPVVEKIADYRELAKLKSTYVDALPELIDPDTGRIHTNFNQAATATGRLSSSDPNLQNIPIRTEVGREIRKAFVADRGKLMVTADYSQIELRITAHLAGDESMIQAFERGEDIHARTAAEIADIPIEAVTYEQRRAAKAVNFGIIYGISAHGLSESTGLGYDEAKKYLEKYFEVHPAIRSYIERTIAQAREKGYVETLFGRKRFMPEIISGNFAVRAAAERMAINFPAQGTAADIIKEAMVVLSGRDLAKYGAKLLLQVHDELVCEVDSDKYLEMAAELKEVMEGAASLRVPLEVSVSYGRNWGQLDRVNFSALN